MKKTLILVAVLISTSFYSVVQAESFILNKSSFSISGNAGSESYNRNGLIVPVAMALTYPNYYADSLSSYNNVCINAKNSKKENSQWMATEAIASAVLDFKANFNNQINSMHFSEEYTISEPKHSHANLTLNDTTDHIELLSISSVAGLIFVYEFGQRKLVEDQNMSGKFDYLFTYAGWNSNHDYQLVMSATSCALNWDSEMAHAAVTTDISFNNIPEPSSILLFSLGVMGFVLVKIKLKRAFF